MATGAARARVRAALSRLPKSLLIAATVVAAVGGCARGPVAAEPEPPAAAPPAALAIFAEAYPASVERYRTTDASIYLGNLEARIQAQRESLARREDATTRGALAGSLLHRFRILGRVVDAEHALAEVEKALAADPRHAEALVLHAALLSSFHRFGEARAALAAARASGASAELPTRLERDLDLAEGRYADLADELAASGHLVANLYELAFRADLRMLQGDPGGASRLWRAAQDLYQDVDPHTLAWLHTQQGIALLRVGDLANAKRFFEVAHARVPQYYLATEHLAEVEGRLGNRARARELYRAVIGQTGNPEFIAALAGVEREDGNEAEAARLEREAEAGYAALLERHRAGYAQHAAEFYLDAGKSAQALALARENIALRQDVLSQVLLAQAAHAAGEKSEACAARERALATGLKPPEISELDALASTCD